MVKKVAIIVERTDVALGGAERSMLEVADALTALGLEVDLLAAKGESTRPNFLAMCQDLPGKRTTLRVFGDALRRHLAQSHYEVVHSVLPFDFADLYQPRGGTYAEAMLQNAASYSNPLARFYKRMTACANRRRMELLHAERRLCQGSQGPLIAPLSRYVADQFTRHYGTDTRRLVVILNGVSTARSVNADDTTALRAKIAGAGSSTGEGTSTVFLFAANNFRLKGLAPLIRAMRLASDGPCERPAHIVVAGSGKADPYRRLAQQLGVEDRVTFLGPLREVQNAISIADVGALPTFYDPSSRFILEALAAGKPVVTTRFNGAADHFQNGRHGIVVDSPDNIRALAEAIRHFTFASHVRRAQQAIRDDNLVENISIRRVAKELLDVYESIARTHATR